MSELVSRSKGPPMLSRAIISLATLFLSSGAFLSAVSANPREELRLDVYGAFVEPVQFRRYVPAPVYRAPIYIPPVRTYSAPIYRAPVYRAPVYRPRFNYPSASSARYRPRVYAPRARTSAVRFVNRSAARRSGYREIGMDRRGRVRPCVSSRRTGSCAFR